MDAYFPFLNKDIGQKIRYLYNNNETTILFLEINTQEQLPHPKQ